MALPDPQYRMQRFWLQQESDFLARLEAVNPALAQQAEYLFAWHECLAKGPDGWRDIPRKARYHIQQLIDLILHGPPPPGGGDRLTHPRQAKAQLRIVRDHHRSAA